eukprot:g1016.t1
MIPAQLPKRGEWLDERRSERAGQTLQQFLSESRAVALPAKTRRKIVLVPLDGEETPPYAKYVMNRRMLSDTNSRMLRDFLRAFLQFDDADVVLAPRRSMQGLASAGGAGAIRTRTDTNSDNETYLQHDISGILNNLVALRGADPAAYCVVGFTPSLLYDSRAPQYKYQAGCALLYAGAAVFSFFTVPTDLPSLRFGALSIMAHEVCHTLGMRHCAYYHNCFMRGSASHEEGLTIPLQCCPVELAKLSAVVTVPSGSGEGGRTARAFDGMKRYRDLRAFYAKYKMRRERDFIDRRLRELEGAAGAQEQRQATNPLPVLVAKAGVTAAAAAAAAPPRDISDVPPAFRPVLGTLFQRTKDPARGDWLDDYMEEGQTFASFTQRLCPVRADKHVHTIELVPVGPFNDDAPCLESLRRFTAAFFCTPCRIGTPLQLASVNEEARRGGSGQLQVTSGAVMRRLLLQRPARDVLCRMAVTMCDLYCIKDGKRWNYLFGQARLNDRVGVFSFARYLRLSGKRTRFPIGWRGRTHDYDGCMCGGGGGGGTLSAEQRKEVLYRSCKILAHETTHMFGVKHCTFFDCVMCGSNCEREAAGHPPFLCPIDLRKLQHCLGFDVCRRYEGLRSLIAQFGWENQ